MPHHSTYNAGLKFRPAPARAHWESLDDGAELTLEAEPSNKYDRYAVKLISGEHHVGYVPKDLSMEIAKRLADGCIERVVKRGGSKIEIHYTPKGVR